MCGELEYHGGMATRCVKKKQSKIQKIKADLNRTRDETDNRKTRKGENG